MNLRKPLRTIRNEHVKPMMMTILQQRRSTPSQTSSPNPSPKPPRLRTARNVLARMMERRERPQRRSIPSPKLLPSLNDTLFCIISP
jgi:hypothetical protein